MTTTAPPPTPTPRHAGARPAHERSSGPSGRPGRSRTRSHPVALAGLAAVGAATTLVAMLTWQVFTQEFGKTLMPLVVLAVVVAGSGALARWWRVPRPLVVLIQVALSGMVASLIICGSPIPLGSAWPAMHLAFEDAVRSANSFSPPVPSDAPPIHPLLIAGGLGCLLLVDVLACTLRRVPLAGLPLLAVLSVPVSMTGDGPHWFLFALAAVGFLSMLFLSESEQVARWGPVLAEDHGGGSEPKAVALSTWPRTGARAIGAVSVVLALGVPLLIPTLDVHLVDFGPGTGGDDDISIENPMIDMRRDLLRGEDVPLVDVTTTDPDPSYLRIAVLNRFSDEDWSSGDREVPSSQTTSGDTPPLIGVSTELKRSEYDYQLSATRDFESTWLPSTSNVSAITAPGDWRFDTSTMDYLASDDDLDTAGLDWDFTAVKLQYETDRLAQAGVPGALVPRSLTDLPQGLPDIVQDLTEEVTANASSRFEKAVALQQWFRKEGGFTYSDSVDPGNGQDDLVRFLTPGEGGRTGYCEQFAASMALMARELGIPARVAVGFLNPEKKGPNTYEFSAHDLHAWPELFFSGSGWVRFEPTPATRANGVPRYTTAPVELGDDGALPSASASAEPEGRARETQQARPEDRAQDDAAAAADQDEEFQWLPVIISVLAVAALVALLLTPRMVRSRRRDQRGLLGPEEAWAELHDTAVDLRLPWPSERSPRQTRDTLVTHFGAPTEVAAYQQRPHRGAAADPDAVAALDRIVAALERLRYARPDADSPGTWRAEMQQCVEALSAGASPSARRRAAWWPASVFVPRRPATRRATSSETVVAGRVVDHVG